MFPFKQLMALTHMYSHIHKNHTGVLHNIIQLVLRGRRREHDSGCGRTPATAGADVMSGVAGRAERLRTWQ